MSFQGTMSCLQDRFDAQVERTPENVAVECEGKKLTYLELARRAAALSRQLAPSVRAPGQPVALLASRSLDMIVGIVGILKAGAAYVPVDPSYPPERVRYLLEDSGVKTVVTGRARAGKLPDGYETISVSDAEERSSSPHRAKPSDAAYVIYTSGSTGTPKGTVVEHHNVTRLFDSTAESFGFGPHDVWTLFHSVSFDFSVWEIWGALLHGGKLLIVPSEIATAPIAFARLVEDSGVTVLNQTPTAFGQFARAAIAAGHAYPDLRVVVFGGERLEASHLRPWVERHGTQQPRLVNMYGITETTVHVTYRPISAADLERPEQSPIGRPISDLTVYLLDESGREVPTGSPGEIVVTGPGVARGYLNRPELTAARFPELPLGPGGRLVRCYRSGDLAFRANGELFYLGRSDDQVKVRGFRIELREVELQLEKSPAIQSCTVIARDFGEGDTRLIAFIVAEPGVTDAAARALEQAARALPPYMCPSHVVEIDEVPLTAHGKKDREALCRLFLAQSGSGLPAASEPARGGSVGKVAELARAILRPNIALEVDLFDQGATSLSLARLILDVNTAFGLTLTGAELDGDSSILNIGAVVDRMIETASGAAAGRAG